METCSVFSDREVRRIVRQKLGGNHGISASVQIGSQHIPITLSDISSLGFAATIPKNHVSHFNIGGRLTIRVSPIKGQHYWISSVVIDKQHKDEGCKIACIIEHEKSSAHGKFIPIQVPLQHSIQGQLSHPFFYTQNYFFDIESISSQGFTLTNIDSDCLLFSGMKVSLRVGVCDQAETIEGTVSDIGLEENNRLTCFFRVANMRKSVRKELTQHLFHYLDITPLELKSAGFNAYCIKELIHYKFVETQEEYEAVLRTRRKNYSGNNKVSANEPLENLSYFFDEYSKILMACHRNKVIGSATMIVGTSGVRPNEIESILSSDELATLPKMNDSVEIASFCLNEEYRNTDILHGLFEHIYINAVMTGRRYLMISSDNKLLRLYKGIGFKESGCGFIQPKYNDLPMKVLVVDKLTAKWGKGMNPLAWWFIWGKSSAYLRDRGVIRYNVLESTRVGVSKMLFQLAFKARAAYKKCKSSLGSLHLSNVERASIKSEAGLSGNRA